MIDLNLYRFRIGIYSPRTRRTKVPRSGNRIPFFDSSNISLYVLIYTFILIYYVLGIACLTMSNTNCGVSENEKLSSSGKTFQVPTF